MRVTSKATGNETSPKVLFSALASTTICGVLVALFVTFGSAIPQTTQAMFPEDYFTSKMPIETVSNGYSLTAQNFTIYHSERTTLTAQAVLQRSNANARHVSSGTCISSEITVNAQQLEEFIRCSTSPFEIEISVPATHTPEVKGLSENLYPLAHSSEPLASDEPTQVPVLTATVTITTIGGTLNPPPPPPNPPQAPPQQQPQPEPDPPPINDPQPEGNRRPGGDLTLNSVTPPTINRTPAQANNRTPAANNPSTANANQAPAAETEEEDVSEETTPVAAATNDENANTGGVTLATTPEARDDAVQFPVAATEVAEETGGINWILVGAVVAFVAAIGVAAYFIYQHHKKKPAPNPTFKEAPGTKKKLSLDSVKEKFTSSKPSKEAAPKVQPTVVKGPSPKEAPKPEKLPVQTINPNVSPIAKEKPATA